MPEGVAVDAPARSRSVVVLRRDAAPAENAERAARRRTRFHRRRRAGAIRRRDRQRRLREAAVAESHRRASASASACSRTRRSNGSRSSASSATSGCSRCSDGKPSPYAFVSYPVRSRRRNTGLTIRVAGGSPAAITSAVRQEIRKCGSDAAALQHADGRRGAAQHVLAVPPVRLDVLDLRRDRAGARVDRRLRRAVVRRVAAHAGDRRPHGARREPAERVRAGGRRRARGSPASASCAASSARSVSRASSRACSTT